MNRILPILLSCLLLTSCAVPRGEDVSRAAGMLLREQFQEDFTIHQAKSTFNEGNGNPYAFTIFASPAAQFRAMFSFSVDYRDDQLILKDKFLQRKYTVARERVGHSTRLVTVLTNHLDEFLTVLDPSLWNEAMLEIYLFRLPTEADKLAYFQRIATALREFRPFPEYQKVSLRLKIFPEALAELPADHFIDKYFRFQVGHASWMRRHMLAVRIDNLNVYDPPSAAELVAALKINATATRVLAARNEAKKQVSAWLRQNAPGQKYQIDNDTLLTEFDGALHRLRFKFKACPEGQSMRRCSSVRFFAAVHGLNGGGTEIHETRSQQ